jgi:hypothetical protein
VGKQGVVLKKISQAARLGTKKEIVLRVKPHLVSVANESLFGPFQTGQATQQGAFSSAGGSEQYADRRRIEVENHLSLNDDVFAELLPDLED